MVLQFKNQFPGLVAKQNNDTHHSVYGGSFKQYSGKQARQMVKNIPIKIGGVLYFKCQMQKKSTTLLNELAEAMEFHANAEQALPMARYMKNKFLFLGIKQPLRKELSADFIKSARLLEGSEIIAICNNLWELPEREYQLIALELLFASRKKWDGAFLLFFKTIAGKKAWWDSIDFIATKLFGGYFSKTKRPALMLAWSTSDDIWKNRIALLFQLNYKQETDTTLLFETILRLKGKQEFFIQKGIGWSLRQYYRTDPGAVKKFIRTAGIEGLAKREALKHA